MNAIPMQRRILLVTDYLGLYRQGMNRNLGIDTDRMQQIFRERGFAVEVTTYDALANEPGLLEHCEGRFVVYTSSEVHPYRAYIRDILWVLAQKNVLVPRFDLLLCHEDKLACELQLRAHGIQTQKSLLFATVKDFERHKAQLRYPVVIKKSDGAGSRYVAKADNGAQLEKLVHRYTRGHDSMEFYPKYWYKRLKGKDVEGYLDSERHFGSFILQEFIPGLAEDWKVLVFGDKFYALNRKVRKNDFRASGSGKFSFQQPPAALLDLAKKVYDAMDVPFLSMDLCMAPDGKARLIEFQGVHFGPYTLVKSDGYYLQQDGEWVRVLEQPDLAREAAQAAAAYMERLLARAGNAAAGQSEAAVPAADGAVPAEPQAAAAASMTAGTAAAQTAPGTEEGNA